MSIASIWTDAGEAAGRMTIAQGNLALAIQYAAKEISRRMRLDFLGTTRTWQNRPEFQTLVEVKGQTVTVLVGTDDRIYRYVDLGTRPHPIFPKKPGGVLAWPGAFTPKTTPGSLKSGAGSSGGDTVFAAYVLRHPGTAPRGFSEMIEKKWSDQAPATVERYVGRWAQNPYAPPGSGE
jgi:hypothetical protein